MLLTRRHGSFSVLLLPMLGGIATLNLIAAPCSVGGPSLVTQGGPDDYNTTQLTPCGASFLTSASNVGGSDWIMSSLSGAGFSNANWNFHYNGASPDISSDFTINQYYGWAVNEPNVTAPDNAQYPGRPGLQNVDAGGAVFVLSFDNNNDSIDFPAGSVHWIQAYRQSLNGGAYTLHLDGNSGTSPYYDANGAHGTYAGHPNAYYMLDTPADCETGTIACGGEGIEDYHTDVQFNVFLAVDNGVIGGKEDVTLWAGYQWGYLYSTQETPEPSFFALSGIALAAIVIWKRRLARHASCQQFGNHAAVDIG
jgi:hypothetical protein